MKLSKMQVDAIVNNVVTELNRLNKIKKEVLTSSENYKKWVVKNKDIVKDIYEFQTLSNRYSDKANYFISSLSIDKVNRILRNLFENELHIDNRIDTKAIENKIILQTINKDFDVDTFIQKLINEFSN